MVEISSEILKLVSIQALLQRNCLRTGLSPQPAAVLPLWEPCVWQAQGTIFNLDFHRVPLDIAICWLVPSWLWYFWILNLCAHCVGRRGPGTPSLALQGPWLWPLDGLCSFFSQRCGKCAQPGLSPMLLLPHHLPRWQLFPPCHHTHSQRQPPTHILARLWELQEISLISPSLNRKWTGQLC